MFEKLREKNDRGQVGIGTLIVFIAMVLVAAIAAGVLINTAGFLQAKSEQTGQDSTAEVSDGVDVVSTIGVVNSTGDAADSEQITQVNITVKKRPGSSEVDLKDVVIQYADGSNTATLDNTGGFSIVDPSGAGGTVLTEDADRYRLAINLTTATDISDSGDSLTKLSGGDKVTLTVVAPSGAKTEIVLDTPNTLTGTKSGEAIHL